MLIFRLRFFILVYENYMLLCLKKTKNIFLILPIAAAPVIACNFNSA